MHPSPVARLLDEQPLHPEADRSPTLAARYYVDPEIFEAEKEAVFYRSWQFAAHRSQLDAPGKFVTTRIHDLIGEPGRRTRGRLRGLCAAAVMVGCDADHRAIGGTHVRRTDTA